jgi:hypothetical protein
VPFIKNYAKALERLPEYKGNMNEFLERSKILFRGGLWYYNGVPPNEKDEKWNYMCKQILVNDYGTALREST